MKLYNELLLKFEKPDWSTNMEFGLIDAILEMKPSIIQLAKEDIVGKEAEHNFGRGDVPTVEQIVRAAIFKEMRGYDYRNLEYAQSDSRICATFIKLEGRDPFSFQMYQKYISRIKASTLQKILYEINRFAIEEGYEDVMKIRTDTTVIESNIHYPTNNSLIWDCIKESHRLLESLKEEITTLDYRSYIKTAKQTYFKINVTNNEDKKTKLFTKQLITFTKCINQTSNAIKKNSSNITVMAIQLSLKKLLSQMRKVHDISYRKEILKEQVSNEEKIFSIYEEHTDIIVKGQREVQFGHKIGLVSGSSNLFLDCEIVRGNPSDSTLLDGAVDRVIANYGIIPRDSVTDGGFASKDNVNKMREKGVVNVVFNKIVGSLKNIVTSKNIETRLKKWRSGIEANISNLKRGFDVSVCNWKGWEHFQAKVLWSALCYNFRVLTSMTLARIKVMR